MTLKKQVYEYIRKTEKIDYEILKEKYSDNLIHLRMVLRDLEDDGLIYGKSGVIAMDRPNLPNKYRTTGTAFYTVYETIRKNPYIEQTSVTNESGVNYSTTRVYVAKMLEEGTIKKVEQYYIVKGLSPIYIGVRLNSLAGERK